MDGVRVRSCQKEMVLFTEKVRDIGRSAITVLNEILSGWHGFNIATGLISSPCYSGII